MVSKTRDGKALVELGRAVIDLCDRLRRWRIEGQEVRASDLEDVELALRRAVAVAGIVIGANFGDRLERAHLLALYRRTQMGFDRLQHELAAISEQLRACNQRLGLDQNDADDIAK